MSPVGRDDSFPSIAGNNQEASQMVWLLPSLHDVAIASATALVVATRAFAQADASKVDAADAL